jgi:hypothetical protein
VSSPHCESVGIAGMGGGGGLSTSVVAVELSLPPTGSVSGLLLTLAVLEIGPLAAGALAKKGV